MAHIEAREITDQTEWEGFLASRPEANFLQSWYWGVFHERLGKTVVRRGFYEGKHLLGVMQAVVEPARRGRHLVVAGGPLLDWGNDALLQAWVDCLRRIGREQHAVFARVRPQLLDGADNRKLMKNLGFVTAPMHVTADLTSQLDLGKTDDELKRAMRKGTRYELNRARKLDIKVEVAADERFLEEFCDLQMETAERQKFIPFTRRFLTEQFKTFAEAGKVLMYRSSHEGQLLAMAFIIFYNDEAAYHYGASTELARKLPGAYAVQWEAIQEARRRGCRRYNFWGMAEHGATKHRFYGVSVFKRGFGGDDVAYLPARDLVIDPVRYAPLFAFEHLRRKLRHL